MSIETQLGIEVRDDRIGAWITLPSKDNPVEYEDATVYLAEYEFPDMLLAIASNFYRAGWDGGVEQVEENVRNEAYDEGYSEGKEAGREEMEREKEEEIDDLNDDIWRKQSTIEDLESRISDLEYDLREREIECDTLQLTLDDVRAELRRERERVLHLERMVP